MAWSITSGPMPSPGITATRADASAAFPRNSYRPVPCEPDSFLLKRGETSRPEQRLNMDRSREPGEDRRAGGRHVALAAAIFCCAGLGMVNGCSTTKHAQGDPLIGEHKGIISPVPP